MRENLRKRKPRLLMRAAFLALCALIFVVPAKAQVYMHNGSSYVGTSGVKFYDAGGPSKGPANYWLHWFSRSEFTYTFNPETAGDAIQVDFESFLAYTDNNGTNDAHALPGTYSLRLNDATLSVYEGTAVDPAKLITTLTGTIVDEFTIMSNGPITFHFDAVNAHTEEGWGATVKAIPATSYGLQKPAISMEVCSDLIVLYPTTLGAQVRYTTNGSNPGTSSTLYEDPFSITYPTTVKAITVIGNQTCEGFADKTYNASDATPVPNANDALIERDGNTIIITPPAVPDQINETYGVIYTRAYNGGTPEDPDYLGNGNPNNVGTYVAPDGWNGTMPGKVHFEWTSPNTNFKFRIVAQTCAKQSAVIPYNFAKLQVPDPSITIEDNNNTGTATITWGENYVIRYTTDGSTPSTTNGTEVTTGTSVTVNGLAPGTTVRVIAYKVTDGAVDPNYDPSNVVTEMYLPGGGNSGTYGGVVILNDFEDHSWSYYSDATNPIRSLNPADVKITYYGNGKMYTSTSATPSGNLSDATGVKVGPSENEDTFIYLKTLERANGDAGTGNLAYTLIPNPFSVRPKFASGGTTYYTGFYGWRVKSLNGVTINGYNVGSIIPAETEIQFVTNNSDGNEVEFEAVWARAYVTNSTSTSDLQASVGYERNFMVLTTTPSSQSNTVTLGNSANTYDNGRYVPLYINRTTGYGYSLSQQIYTASEIGAAGSITSIGFRVQNAQSSNRTLHIYMTSTSNTTFNYNSEWGAYESETVFGTNLVFSGTVNFNQTGWRTIMLDTPFDYDGSSNIIVTVFDATGTYMRTSPRFYTYSGAALYNSRTTAFPEEGYYFAMNSSNYKPQIQFTKVTPPGHDVSTVIIPCTVMGCNPDGTNQSTGTIAGNVTCGADLKLEHINVSGSSTSTMNGNGHSLIIGRGVTSSSENVAGSIYGYYGASGSVNAFNLRIESGHYNKAYLFYNNSTSQISSSNNWKMTLGSDYDRAQSDNSKLVIAGPAEVSYRVSSSSASAKINVLALSGTFGVAADDNELYMGYESRADANTAATPRFLEVLGGEFLGGIAGGIENGVAATTNVLTMRIKGGTIHQYVYGAGQFSEAVGTRKTIITGGNFDAWVAGGCYGTDANGNAGNTNGDSYIYFGGDATMTNTEGVFGGGYGRGDAGDNKYTINKSFVVVADEAQIAGNVYGGGNKGYNTDDAEVYVLGGGKNTITVSGSVFGGANQARSEATTTVTMENGTVGGSLYGGANTSGNVAGLATVNVSGGKVSNVFGGGLGANTSMAAGTAVNVSGGTINNNVYGGGEEGTVTGNTNVKVSGGTMKDVYGAGKGVSGTTGSKATITGQTFVEVTGGTIANVYGGGENGNIENASSGSTGGTLTYDFEDGTQGWTTIDADGHGDAWSRSTGYAHGGNYSMDATYNSSYAHNDYLVSPQFTLGGSFSFYARRRTTSYADTFRVYLSTRGNSNASDFTIELTNGNVTPGDTYLQYTYDLSSYSGLGYVAIVYTAAADQYHLYVDDITITQPEQQEVAVASTVTINGGNISENVFGGGAFGTTDGGTIVNVKNGSVHGSVYGGALGEQHQVYVAGRHTVNVMGGHVFANVYGGSRNADDALSFEPGDFETATNEETVCVVNISGGQIDQQVYAAGFFGNCFGSVFAFVGKDAIYNAPNHVETLGSESAGEEYTISKLSITGSVWAGGDWGTFVDQFGAPTISGNSNVYVDGKDYITNTSDKNTVGYMGIDGSLFGSGTSCDAGKKEHTVMLRNYGQSQSPYNSATRNFGSIQRADYIVLDNVHVDFLGQGRINSLNVTEVYSLYEATEAVIVTGGSTLIMDAPVDQVMTFWSTSCSDVYTAELPTKQTDGTYNNGDYTVVNPSTLSATPNKIRVTGGNYIKIYHNKQIASGSGNNVSYEPGYGMLNGYAYMMTADDNEATCAYARPRWCANDDNLFHINDATYDNRNDGGWVSYVDSDNVFDLEGNEGNVQMAYENHTPGSKVGESYFRIWRTTGQIHEREGVFDVVAYGNNVFKYVDVEIELPAWRGHDYYYAFQTKGTAPALATTTDYGPELMTYNAALYNDNAWIYYNTSTKAQVLEANTEAQNEIRSNPDVNYGLVILSGKGDALSSPQIGGATAPALIINNDADEFLVKRQEGEPINKFTYTTNDIMPTVKFRLTYSDLLSSNKTYEPMWVNLVQCDKNGNVKDIVKIKLIVNTSTIVGRNFETEVYAVMNGNGSTAEEAHAQVVLPRFNLNVPGVDSRFTVESIDWTPATLPTNGGGSGTLVNIADGGFDKTKFAMEFSISENYDGTTGWNELTPTIYDTKVEFDRQTGDPHALDPADLMGTTGGRSQFSFDFALNYNGQEELVGVVAPELMGTLVYHMRFTNYGETTTQYPNGSKDFTITIKVYRRGMGNRFYLDGVNGKNSYPGTKPDRAMLTLGAIFTRSGFLPGDEVYVVNQVTADDDLEWNGLTQGGQVKIYRYNGGHELFDEEVGIIGNPDNAAYTGALVDVPNGGHMIIRGIDLDGYYNNGGEEGVEYSTVTATSPLITVQNGGILELNQAVLLEQNYNTNDGGAVYVNNGGTLMMNQDASITDNKTDGNGGGVYMNGTMIASDMVKVWDNTNGNGQNNVYLAGVDKKLQIGEDNDSENYKELAYVENDAAHSAFIGLSKPIDYFVAGIAEVVYSNELAWLDEPHETQAIIVHDGEIYKLETGADPNILYWIDTWVTWVTSKPEGFSIDNIDSEEDLAWVISLVNGENGCDPDDFTDKKVIIKKDLDMHEHTWVPIGERNNVFKGEFEGNGFVIEGLVSSLYRTDLGMFGITQNANIHDMVAVANFNGVANNYATVIGTMRGGTLANVEAAGNLTGDDEYAQNIGGLVAVAEDGSTIHSSFAVNTIVAQRDETTVGGLVAVNGADLYNSYSNVTVTGTQATNIGGLVGVNTGHVENCYAAIGEQTFPAFAYDNSAGEITICYADASNGYVGIPGDDASLTGHGLYSEPLDRKAIGYMYDDNKITFADGQSNGHVVSAITYGGGKIDRWPGMLDALNHWVETHTGYTKWFRPTSGDINSDLPILGFDTDNSLASTDGKFLRYSSIYNGANGLDNLFARFDGKSVNMFLYGNAVDVTKGNGSNMLFINEDAALLQKATDGVYSDITATVGITFDNSCRSANDYWGNNLDYDWHFLSSSLSDAPMGTDYSGTPTGFDGPVNIVSMVDNYLPNGLPMGSNYEEGVKWDLYSYYEPQYHWINLKRSTGDHWHYDGYHEIIPADQYTNETIFVPAKGYMMAISQDSYLSSSGTLNNGDVSIDLTHQEPEDIAYNRGWNLVGNPYQAYLNLGSIPNGGSYYIYDADQNVYAPVTDGQSENPCIPSLYIHPHQGFFMYVPADATFTFDYDWATSTKQDGSYYRGAENQVNYPLVNLFAENGRGNRDLAVIEFNRPKLGGATKVQGLRNANFQIAASLEGQKYGILFTPEGTERVPVHFNFEENGIYTLRWNTQNGEFTSLRLVDNKTGVNCDMLANDHYTFEASTDDYASRFYITYACIGVEEDVTNADDNFAFFDGSEWIVNGKGQLDVIDMTGRVLYTVRLNNDQNRVNLDGFAQGVYLMRVIDNKVVRTQKIIVR
ncbi:MAG: choice-of-anchor J domain-containing protein [Bacteroidales bacterium]|nr:choice-of-anchor J domain-containing protein [Bacteroidales bacterium]